MVGGRRAVVAEAIADRGRAAGETPSIVHLCQACTALMEASAVCAAMTAAGVYEPVGADGGLAMVLAELQVTAGQGPGVEVMAGDRPVLVTDLDSAATQARWPLFAPPAADHGLVAVFAFPLLVGAFAIGALEIYWDQAPEGRAAAGDGLLFAQAALTMLVARSAPGGGPVELPERWPEVHQATGMVSAQLAVGVDEAYAQLRGYAYGHGLGLRDVARQVVDRTLSFRPEREP